MVPFIKNRVALIFTEASVADVKPMIEGVLEWRNAKVGNISNCSVVIPKGNTGLPPAEVNFFHALNLSTKIVKNKITLENNVPILAPGDVVTPSAAALLAKLDITPFSFGMKVTGVYDDGVMLSSSIISM